jgi:hypothetical protein
MNAAWHRAHPMPRNATLDQRIAFHSAHARNCACPPMPEEVRDELAKRGLKVPISKDQDR